MKFRFRFKQSSGIMASRIIDASYRNRNKIERYYVAGYFDERLAGLDDTVLTDDFSEAVNEAHRMASDGCYILFENTRTGSAQEYSPDEWLDAVELGEVPQMVYELV